MTRYAMHAVFLACLWFGLGWGTTTARAAETATFEVVARDGRLFPERLEVPANTKLKLVIKNQGKTAIEFESIALRVEKVLAPGATSFVVIHPLKPGTYEFVDEFHEQTGKMQVIAK